ncbi:hypothetical protein [Marinobacter sp.]|uniref:hypothetical protein n=1 Tax=Marinobacter sp. TaxID=50741 RepID=UPI0035674DCF
MRTLRDLFRHYQIANERVDQEIMRLRYEGVDEGFEAYLAKCLPESEYPCDWVTMLAKPIGEQIKQAGGFQRVEVLGPMGIGARVSFHCYKNAGDSIQDIQVMTVEPCLTDLSDSPLRVVDYSTNTGRYAPGTTGDVNGLNHPCRPIDPRTAGDGWLQYLS